MENKLYYRDGREFTGNRALIGYDKAKPYVERQTMCSRCGGAGGSDKWKHTGWTCYQCGGTKLGPVVKDKLYTLEQIAKLNAAQEKRNTKKAAERAATAAKLEQERNAKRAEFKETHKAFFEQAATLADTFVDTMISQCIERVSISDRQIELINGKLAERAKKQGSTHVGTVGERRDFTCKIEKILNWSRTQSWPKIYRYCHVMRDEQGNAIKYVGSAFIGSEGETITFKAKVEEHGEYNGEKQTTVTRPKLATVPQPEGTKGGTEEPWK